MKPRIDILHGVKVARERVEGKDRFVNDSYISWMLMYIIPFSQLEPGSQSDWIQTISSILAFAGIIWTLRLQSRATKLQAEATALQAAATEDQLKSGNLQRLSFMKSVQPRIIVKNISQINPTFGTVCFTIMDNPAKNIRIENFSNDHIKLSQDFNGDYPEDILQSGTEITHDFIIEDGCFGIFEINVHYSDIYGNSYKEKFFGTTDIEIVSVKFEFL